MKNSPMISIITAVRNGEPYLRSLIESVLQQDYPSWEHIIIDDGSDDKGATRAILQSYPHLCWWSRENRGQYTTQNEGLATAKGDIICVISADDIFVTPSAFLHVVDYWQTHSHCELVYGKTLQMDKRGKLLSCQLDITGKYPSWFLRHYLYIQHCSLFVAKSLVIDNGIWFNPSFRYAGDWDWIVRLFNASTGTQIGYLEQPLAVIRKHSTQTSKTAEHTEVLKEHKAVCETHKASYHLHLILRKWFQYRAMVLIAATTLNREGFDELVSVGIDWGRRRYARFRSRRN